MNVLSLFDGIACARIALERAGVKVDKYYASEVDKYAIKVAMNNYPDIIQLGDITQLNPEDLQKLNIDLICGGSPCQDLSGLKNDGRGLAGEKSKLLLDFVQIKNTLTPKWYLLENVVPRRKEWEYAINRLVGVSGVRINSDLFVPQNRPRVYWTNIPILELPERPDWSTQYYQYRRTYFRQLKSGVCPCLTANMGTGGHNVPLKSENLRDRLTPEECEVLQAIPSGYTVGVSNSQRYKMIGNAWTVDVVAHIFKGINNEIVVS